MKAKFSLILVILVQHFSFAQIILTDSYNGILQTGCFSSGAKYVAYDELLNTTNITVYNLDHSILKSMNIPSQGNGVTYAILYIADDLFDNDSTSFEYAMNQGIGSGQKFKIYRDDQSLIAEYDSVYSPNSQNASQEYKWIFSVNDSGVFLPLYNGFTNQTKIYKLPGKIHYCNSCCSSGGVFTGNAPDEKKSTIQLGNAVPNPSWSTTSISYELPEGYTEAYLVLYDLNGNEVKRYLVGSAFHNIQVSSGDLPQGTYLYNLQTKDGKSNAKKMVVIN